jgi:hypothetical protein
VHPTTAVATAFFAAMDRKSLEEAPIAEDSSYESPLTPEPIAGREHLIRFIGAYLPAMKEVRVIRHIAGGDHVATIWQAGRCSGPSRWSTSSGLRLVSSPRFRHFTIRGVSSRASAPDPRQATEAAK